MASCIKGKKIIINQILSLILTTIFFLNRKSNQKLRSLPTKLTSMRVQEWHQIHQATLRVQVAALVVMKILIQAREVTVAKKA